LYFAAAAAGSAMTTSEGQSCRGWQAGANDNKASNYRSTPELVMGGTKTNGLKAEAPPEIPVLNCS